MGRSSPYLCFLLLQQFSRSCNTSIVGNISSNKRFRLWGFWGFFWTIWKAWRFANSNSHLKMLRKIGFYSNWIIWWSFLLEKVYQKIQVSDSRNRNLSFSKTISKVIPIKLTFFITFHSFKTEQGLETKFLSLRILAKYCH